MRYFFDIADGSHWIRDDMGIDCKDEREARRQAVLALAEMAREYIPSNGASMDLAVRIRHAGKVAFTVHLDFSTEAGPGLEDPSALHSHT